MKKSYIPNLFTFINLSLGVMSILMTFRGQYLTAGLYIIAAGIVDRYDGRVARFLEAESEVGKELDSLADNVSFGVAPGILVYLMFHLDSLVFGIIPVLLYVICGCYRLARYNSVKFDGIYHGIPITLSGTALPIFALLMGRTESFDYKGFVVIFVMLAFAYLMVSNISFKKR